MKFFRMFSFAAPIFATCSLLAACGNTATLTPSVTIRSPADNSSNVLPANKQLPITFDTNYNLKAPGQCGSLASCGSIYLFIDSTSCNLSASQPYNALVVSSPTLADFSKCATPTGMHTITMELRDDSGANVKGVLGAVIATLKLNTT